MGKWTNKYIIGLTGNIGTGKSEIRKILQCFGALGIDADLISRYVMEPDGKAYPLVLERFGMEFVAADQKLDRNALAGVVFQQPDRLAELESIVHPLVVEEVERILNETKIPVVVIEAIKLIESGLMDYCDALWVADAPVDVRMERLTLFREMSVADASARIQAQPPQKEKLKAASVVIQNKATLEDLLLQVKDCWEETVPESFRASLQDCDSV